jgi:endonuclease III
MERKERYRRFIEHFSTHQPEADTELEYSNPFELLVAVILSAQCTDKRINIVTPPLFRDFPTAEHLAVASFDELFPYIKSVSYPNNKTRHLLNLGKMLTEKYNGNIPDTVDELQKLPGVGRKTANVIASVIYNQPTMAVDTHVFRVSKRIGLVPQSLKTPLQVELSLLKYIPENFVPRAHHWLILHGRYVCLARRPKCEICPLTEFCLYFEKVKAVSSL